MKTIEILEIACHDAQAEAARWEAKYRKALEGLQRVADFPWATGARGLAREYLDRLEADDA